MTAGAIPAEVASRRRLVLVVGSGRSGTSVIGGVLQRLGCYVPQPEVPPDETNPHGFAESQWVVDFHQRLLRSSGVGVSDSRPAAWFKTGQLALDDKVRSELRSWLAKQFGVADEIVIKDPRLSWFLPVWHRSAHELGAVPTFVTMLRHPAEVINSKQRWYGTWQGDASRAAGWLNQMLYTERATRAAPRVFVRFEDLLADWPRTIARVGDTLDLSAVRTARTTAIRGVHRFVDPDLRRSRSTWDDVEIPRWVQKLADETWEQLSRLPDEDSLADTGALAESDGEARAAEAALDDARATYLELYEECEAIAQSSIIAARNRGKAFARQATSSSLVLRLARHTPRRYRQLVPLAWRRRVVRTSVPAGKAAG